MEKDLLDWHTLGTKWIQYIFRGSLDELVSSSVEILVAQWNKEITRVLD